MPKRATSTPGQGFDSIDIDFTRHCFINGGGREELHQTLCEGTLQNTDTNKIESRP